MLNLVLYVRDILSLDSELSCITLAVTEVRHYLEYRAWVIIDSEGKYYVDFCDSDTYQKLSEDIITLTAANISATMNLVELTAEFMQVDNPEDLQAVFAIRSQIRDGGITAPKSGAETAELLGGTPTYMGECHSRLDVMEKAEMAELESILTELRDECMIWAQKFNDAYGAIRVEALDKALQEERDCADYAVRVYQRNWGRDRVRAEYLARQIVEHRQLVARSEGFAVSEQEIYAAQGGQHENVYNQRTIALAGEIIKYGKPILEMEPTELRAAGTEAAHILYEDSRAKAEARIEALDAALVNLSGAGRQILGEKLKFSMEIAVQNQITAEIHEARSMLAKTEVVASGYKEYSACARNEFGVESTSTAGAGSDSSGSGVAEIRLGW